MRTKTENFKITRKRAFKFEKVNNSVNGELKSDPTGTATVPTTASKTCH